MGRKAVGIGLSALLLQLSATWFAIAQSPSEFYQGKTVTLYIGGEAGGGYDLYARALSRHLGSNIAGRPAILPVNMPGAGGMILGNYLAEIAPRDGSAIGIVSPLTLFEPLFHDAQSLPRFRASQMTMIGNGASAHWVLLARHSVDVSSIDDLRHRDLVVGTTGRASAAYILARVTKEILGLTHLKIVTGYGGIGEVVGAVERGEISGCVMDLEDVSALRPKWLPSGEMDVVVQLSGRNATKGPLRVPSAVDFALSDGDRQVLDVIFASTTLSRPLIAPPEIPTQRTKSLRDGLAATFKDADFMTEAERLKITPRLTSGEAMQEMIRSASEAQSPILARLRAVLRD